MQLGRALSRPQETPSLWRAWLVSAWPSPKWIERPEGDESLSLWRGILFFFALLLVAILGTRVVRLTQGTDQTYWSEGLHSAAAALVRPSAAAPAFLPPIWRG